MLGVLLAGLLAGIVSGMGIGGGAILIPVILWVTDVTQQQAQGVNLLYFLPTAAVALVTHVKMEVETPVAKSSFGQDFWALPPELCWHCGWRRTAAEIVRRFSLCRWSGRAV